MKSIVLATTLDALTTQAQRIIDFAHALERCYQNEQHKNAQLTQENTNLARNNATLKATLQQIPYHHRPMSHADIVQLGKQVHRANMQTASLRDTAEKHCL
jgi:hypothetical protein